MKGNPLLKFLAIPVVIVVIFVALKLIGNKHNGSAPADGAPALTKDQAKALGLVGDTPGDTMRTLVAESKQLKAQIGEVINQNKQQKQENDELKQRLSTIDQNIDKKLASAQDNLKQDSQRQQQGLINTLKSQMGDLSTFGKEHSNSNSDLPIGLGVQPGDGQQFKKTDGNSSDILWIDPEDATPIDATGKPIAKGSSLSASGFNFPTSFGQSVDSGQKALTTSAQQVSDDVGGQQQARKKVRRVYTLPQNSTLMGSVAMSALIGRVPVDGTVNDPYPFKVLIGPDNLTANGIDLPDVAGAVASGTASGDWTLSCVRGQIKSMTFVFTDGTVRTLPAPNQGGNQQQNNNQASSGQQQPVQGGMGWISDAYGIPCISGERRSNAAQYIGSQALITAAGAGAASLIKTDGSSSSYVSTASGTLGTTGISGNEAMGRILGQGVSDISTWVNKLYGQAFAAIYVQPGAQVALHLDQELDIDYEIKGRKVNYTTGGSHVSANLD